MYNSILFHLGLLVFDMIPNDIPIQLYFFLHIFKQMIVFFCLTQSIPLTNFFVLCVISEFLTFYDFSFSTTIFILCRWFLFLDYFLPIKNICNDCFDINHKLIIHPVY